MAALLNAVAAALPAQQLRLARRPGRAAAAGCRLRYPRSASIVASVKRTGVREERGGGAFVENYSFDLLGLGKLTTETLEAGAGRTLVALTSPRPMGVVFEEVAGLCQVTQGGLWE